MTNPSPAPNGKNADALWRKHFPVDSASEAAHSRRGFLGGLAIAGGSIACCQSFMANDESVEGAGTTDWSEFPPMTLALKLDELGVGQSHLFHFPDHRSPCLLIKTTISEFVAYSQKCTHLACPVVPEVDEGKLHCPCHHGVFDLQSGQPLAGPPRRPLPQVRVELQSDGSLVATAIAYSPVTETKPDNKPVNKH
ncbi:MAG: Rieske (2Fe-2S) protein [Planctomycetota bacterium]